MDSEEAAESTKRERRMCKWDSRDGSANPPRSVSPSYPPCTCSREAVQNGTAARNAFASSIKAYATHPAAEKAMFNTKSLHLGHLAKSFGMREAPGSSSTLKSKKGAKSVGRVSIQRPIGRVISAREAADRAIASLPARNSGERGEGFETGRRFDEDRAMKRQQEKVMKGPTGEGGGEFQIASSAMLESLAKSQNQANNASGGGKRKRAGY